MSSGGGTSGASRRRSSLRSGMTRAFTMPTEGYTIQESEDAIMEESEDAIMEESGGAITEESGAVPSSLAHIVGPIFCAADEIEQENPRVAYLCRFTASKKAHNMDPSASEGEVERFKTKLTGRLEKEKRETLRRLASDDAKEVYMFYEQYCRKHLEAGLQMRKLDMDEMAKCYQTASVLIDVLKIVLPADFHPESDKYAKVVEKEKSLLTRYNILPLNISGSTQPIMEIPEIKAAVGLLRVITNLPYPEQDPTSVLPIVRDLLDWLGLTFGFQKGNVENQKEHFILLLGNIQMRKGRNALHGERYNQVIQSNTVIYLMKKVFQNYISWCQHLDLESNIKIPKGASTQQPELLYIGLYLLIWGEASNVRFMPECLCYIFHHMASDLYRIIREEVSFDPPFPQDGRDDAFLQRVIQPIYNVIQKEAETGKHATVSHGEWGNYDDLNEYFWLNKCFKTLGWPLDIRCDFFAAAEKIKIESEQRDHAVSRHDNVVRTKGRFKTNFVEVRTFLHLFRSFDRLWAFFILAFQAMVIIAWNPSGSLSAIFEPAVFRNVSTIFITAAFLNFLQATLELFLNWKAWRSLLCSQMIRYILKFVVAIAWLIILPTTYSTSDEVPTGLAKFIKKWIGNSRSESIYSFTVALYMLPNIFSVLFFIFLPIRRAFERSNSCIVRFLLWWTQPKLYVARGMYEDTCSLLKYTLFWVLLLICKLAFSYYVEIAPLVGLTRTVVLLGQGDKKIWLNTLGVVFTIWAPIVMVYFMDTQIWYGIFSIICGGVTGTFSRFGEIQTLGNLKSRFEAITRAFDRNLVSRPGSQSMRQEHEEDTVLHVDKFSGVWNAFIDSLRYEDLISNRERYLLVVPSSIGDTTMFRWPIFLLTNKISSALDIARSAKKRGEELRQRLKEDPYAYHAVIECYETLLNMLSSLIEEPDKEVVDRIRESIDDSIRDQSIFKEFRLDELRVLSVKFDKLLNLLLRFDQDKYDKTRKKIANILPEIMGIITRRIMEKRQRVVNHIRYRPPLEKIRLDELPSVRAMFDPLKDLLLGFKPEEHGRRRKRSTLQGIKQEELDTIRIKSSRILQHIRETISQDIANRGKGVLDGIWDQSLLKIVRPDDLDLDAMFDELLNLLQEIEQEDLDIIWIQIPNILRDIMEGFVHGITTKVYYYIRGQSLLEEIQLGELPGLSVKFEKLLNLLRIKHEVDDPIGKQISNIVQDIIETIRQDIREKGQRACNQINIGVQSLLKEFRLEELPDPTAKLFELLNLHLRIEHDERGTIRIQIVNILQDIMETITRDIMKKGLGILKNEDRENQLFANLNLDLLCTEAWREKLVRLQLLLTTEDSATYVPTNLEARRRITFFANSLFMKMPWAPQVRTMMSFSVLTPHFKEEVLFSAEDLHKKKDDGISLLFYLQQIYPDEWKNFLERINFKPNDEDDLKYKMEESRWASYKGHTLTRTVRGQMYYRRALEIQCIQDRTDIAMFDRHRTTKSYQEGSAVGDMALAISDIKFTYVVSCRAFGMQKNSKCHHEKDRYWSILDLMKTYPALRVAYIDKLEAPTENGTTDKTHYSVLVKGVGEKEEEIYRIKLPGKPYIGEERSENKNNAIIFTRGEALQAIYADQDHYLEEAFKMRNILEEFASETYGKSKPTILRLHKHIFTGSVSSLAWFVSNQESSFVTIGQRVLANHLKVWSDYGHSDIFDRLFHITRGGVSKASKTINLSQDIFSGFNSIMREGNVTHHEYMQVGKGCDAGLHQISKFEAEVANGNAEQTLSRDIYRLGRRFDFYRMLSLYFTTVGFYFNSMVTVLVVYVFLYGRLYLVMSQLEKTILMDPAIHGNIKPLDRALASQAIFQLGLMLVLPMFMEVVLQKGLCIALGEFVILQLQLASVFFTFKLGTRTHYYGRTILHGAAKYKPTGCPFVVHRTKFAEIYRMYSRSHFVKALELLILLVVCLAYGSSYHSSNLHLFVTFSIWFLVASWLFAPFFFNPSCFEWQKMNGDWIDWRRWMRNRRGIGMREEDSWEVWWISEQEHLRKASIRALLLEIILSLRFLIYQYVIVYHLNITRRSRSILVYAFSWLIMLTVLVVLKIVSIGGQKFEDLLFLGSVPVMVVLFVVCKLTISDVFASILGFIPTGWCILLIGQACSPLLKKSMLWDSFVELGRAYDYMMGLIIFMPIKLLSRFSFASAIQTQLLFNQALRRGLQIPKILAGQNNTELD